MQRRKLNAIEVSALRIAASMPLRPSSEHGTGYVRWQYIVQLRQELEEAGVDWKSIHKLFKQEEEEARRKRAERYR